MNYAIIAAGQGSRLQSEGVAVPKPLMPLDGRPLIGRLIDIFLSLNSESISVIVNEEMTEVQQYLRTRPVQVIVKSTPSSMHSLYELSHLLKDKFILTTVDTVFLAEDFRRYAEAWESDAEHDGLMAVTPYIDDEKPLYVEVTPDSLITAFSDSPGSRYVSGGIYGLKASALPVLEGCIARGQSRMRNFQRALIAAGFKLKAWKFPKIIDVDHQSDIAKAEAYLNE